MRTIASIDGRFAFAELPDPVRKGPEDVLIQVEHVSLNGGEINAT